MKPFMKRSSYPMMKSMLVILSIFLLTACDFENTLKTDVLLDIKRTVRKDYPDFKVKSFELEPITDDFYVGYLEAQESGEWSVYHVEVVLYDDDTFEWEIMEEGYLEEEPYFEEEYDSNSYEQPAKKESVNSLKDHLRNNSFAVNGNGSVVFRFTTTSEVGSVQIDGGRATLMGDCEVSGKTLYINNLKAMSGSFDASNNEGSSGSFYLLSDGSLSGSLYDNQGNSREIEFTVK